jgi:hypothetical protein
MNRSSSNVLSHFKTRIYHETKNTKNEWALQYSAVDHQQLMSVFYLTDKCWNMTQIVCKIRTIENILTMLDYRGLFWVLSIEIHA